MKRGRWGVEGFGSLSLLGLTTIAAYGTWYYAFGVLLDPLLDDTGWPERWVTGSFALSTALGAVIAPLAGRLLDRFRSRRLFTFAAVVSAVAFIGASYAGRLVLFVPCAVIGGASLSGFGFYHVTQTTAVRVAPSTPSKAIAVLTIYGAFASTLYLPLAAALVSRTDWRFTLRVLALITAAVLLGTALLVSEEQPDSARKIRRRITEVLSSAPAKRYALATACIGVAAGILLVYQVPLMTDAGLPLTTAASLAGARGAAQLGGRLPMHLLVERFGARGSLQLAFGAIAVGSMLLAGAGHIGVALAFVVIAGFGIGATSPLQGVYAAELFEPGRLGESMGTMAMIFGLSGAAGPAAVGLLNDLVGTRRWGIVIAAGAALAATALMRRPAALEPTPVAPVAS